MSSPIADSFQHLWESILRLVRRKRTLADFSHDELRTERARLEASEARALRDLNRLEQEKAALFEAAKREGSQAVREVQARKIRDINGRLAAAGNSLTRIGKMLRLVESVMAGKELGRMTPGTSEIVDTILEVDGRELQEQVEQGLAEASVTEQKIDQIVSAFDEAESSGHHNALGLT